MRKTIRGSVDFIEPEFLHALGIAVTTFAQLESVLVIAFFYARHNASDFASFPKTAIEIYDCDFNSKIDKTFKEIKRNTKNFTERGFDQLRKDVHKSRIARNFVVHGVWLRGQKEGFYKCSMIDRAGRRVQHEVNKDILLSEATRANHLMIELKTLLVAEGLYPPVGPRIGMSKDDPDDA